MPRCLALEMVTISTPVLRAFCIAISMALGVTMIPWPRSESMLAMDAVSRTTLQLGLSLISPRLYWAT